MARHTILFGCGHIGSVELEGTESRQSQRIIYLKICGRCPECEKKYRANQTAAEEQK
jgi:hypothetical protein